MSIGTGSTSLLEPVLDALPSPKLLVQLGTGRMLYANPAAHRLAGGKFPIAAGGDEYAATYQVYDESGRELANEEHPAVRAAAGERLHNVPVEWETPGGRRSLLVSADTVALPGAEPVAVVTFEDVSELQDARRRALAAEAEVTSILGGVADAITAQAPDGTLVYANEAAVRLIGYESVAALLEAPIREVAARFEMLDENLRPLAVEDLPGRRALAGENPEPLIVRSRQGGDRETRWTRVKATPVFDERGSVRLAINVIEDISELKRAEQAQRFLAEAGRALGASLDYQETLSTVARLAVPDIADWCGVDVVGHDGELERVAAAHVDPEKVQAARDIAGRYPPDPASETGLYGVLRSGRSEVYGHITDEMLVAAAADEEHLAMLRSIGMTSVMIVPMALRGTVLGAMTFVSAEAGHTYTGPDLELAESLASHAAAAVENSRLYRARSEIARTLQASLLPPALPEVRGFDLAAAYQPAGEDFDVGGDFYDVFNVAEDQWYAVIGDVCGKGADAAAVTAMARYTLRAAAVRRRSPAAILRLLNEAMLRHESAEEGRFCTIACLHLDVSRSPARVTVACGGHPMPIALRADGSVDELGVPGTLIGLVEPADFQDQSGVLAPGDTLLLYTDGLTEAGAPQVMWSPEDLLEVVRGAAGRSADRVVEHLLDAALALQPAPRDDIAIVALQARPD
jgi:PAS domain S-box-containing protein